MTLGPVGVMGAGVVVILYVIEVIKLCMHYIFADINNKLVFQFHVHHWTVLTMEQSIVHLEMMEFLPMKTLVVSHVTLVMSWSVMVFGHVIMTAAGVAVISCAVEVSTLIKNYYYKLNIIHIMYNELSLTVICDTLNNPNNGVINCSVGDDGVHVYNVTCSFTCNTGYKLTGSDTRTCQSNGSWSGTNAMCRRGT